MASAPFLMRAYRSIDGSFHTWRAGEFDDDMSETTPPHPPGEYSNFVVLAHLGGPLARSDEEAFNLAGLGTSGTPVTFPSGASIPETAPGTDCRDFSSISLWIIVTNAPTLPAVVSIKSYWTHIDAATGGTDGGIQASDDAISAGVSTQNQYEAQYPITTLPGVALGPYNVPVRGRRHVALLNSDTGDVEGYVIAMRMA